MRPSGGGADFFRNVGSVAAIWRTVFPRAPLLLALAPPTSEGPAVIQGGSFLLLAISDKMAACSATISSMLSPSKRSPSSRVLSTADAPLDGCRGDLNLSEAVHSAKEAFDRRSASLSLWPLVSLASQSRFRGMSLSSPLLMSASNCSGGQPLSSPPRVWRPRHLLPLTRLWHQGKSSLERSHHEAPDC